MARFKIWSNTAEFMRLDGIEPAPMAELHAYWRDAGVAGDIPRQKDLSIREMPDCLGHIALLDLSLEPLEAKYLIVGDALKTLLGADPTGQSVRDVYPESIHREVLACFDKAARNREALYYRREFEILGRSFGYNRLVLPLRLERQAVRRVLICIYPLSRTFKSARQWRRQVAKLEELERLEQMFETRWAESLGYKMITSDTGEADDPLYLVDELKDSKEG